MQTLPLSVYESIRANYSIPDQISITAPADVLQIKKVAQLSVKSTESFSILTLNGAGHVIRFHTITTGLLNHSLVHPREVFRAAIKDNAGSIIALHNHPSGALYPSDQDINVTNQLKEAGKIIGIELLDHIIISKSGIGSMREQGYI